MSTQKKLVVGRLLSLLKWLLFRGHVSFLGGVKEREKQQMREEVEIPGINSKRIFCSQFLREDFFSKSGILETPDPPLYEA